MPLKVYLMNYDGTNERMVAAKSMREAASLFGTTVYQLRNFGSIDNRESSAWAKGQPGMVYQRRMYYGPESERPDWARVARLP